MTEELKKEKAKNLRYKKPICRDLNLDAIREELWEMQEVCEDVRWFESDNENLVAAFEGDEDEAYEFRMAFSDLEAELERFQEELEDTYIPDCFDELFPAAHGSRYDELLGFDSYEGDYYGLQPYEYRFAEEIAERHILRLTKKELLEAVGACLKVVMSYLAVRYRYDCLEASLRILQDRNMQTLKLFKAIEEQYEKAEDSTHHFEYIYHKEYYKLETMLSDVPQEVWLQ